MGAVVDGGSNEGDDTDPYEEADPDDGEGLLGDEAEDEGRIGDDEEPPSRSGTAAARR